MAIGSICCILESYRRISCSLLPYCYLLILFPLRIHKQIIVDLRQIIKWMPLGGRHVTRIVNRVKDEAKIMMRNRSSYISIYKMMRLWASMPYEIAAPLQSGFAAASR